MRPYFALIIATVLVLVLCERMAGQAAAKVVQDEKAAPSNPAVEEGGYRLPPGTPPPPVPYSLVGALASESHWLAQCATWPWRFFGSASFHNQPFLRPSFFHPPFLHPPFLHPGPFGGIPPRSPINWTLPPLP
jgi:hypothetical protein